MLCCNVVWTYLWYSWTHGFKPRSRCLIVSHNPSQWFERVNLNAMITTIEVHAAHALVACSHYVYGSMYLCWTCVESFFLQEHTGAASWDEHRKCITKRSGVIRCRGCWRACCIGKKVRTPNAHKSCYAIKVWNLKNQSAHRLELHILQRMDP